ncbi:MAG: hypothetical protein SNG38_08330 [Rikenellaceae bacterium]
MQGKRGKKAYITIRALIKAKVISFGEYYRRAAYKAISGLIYSDIGSDSSINKYWNDDTIEGK